MPYKPKKIVLPDPSKKRGYTCFKFDTPVTRVPFNPNKRGNKPAADIQYHIDQGDSFYICMGGGSLGLKRYHELARAIKTSAQWLKAQCMYDEARIIRRLYERAVWSIHGPYHIQIPAEHYALFMHCMRHCGKACGVGSRWSMMVAQFGKRGGAARGVWPDGSPMQGGWQ